jgi:hypothetical protein
MFASENAGGAGRGKHMADAALPPAVDHSINSVLRERIVEHLFVGDLLRRLWQRGVIDVEVLRSEFDAGGYDLVLSRGKVVRHVQLKTVVKGGSTSSLKVSMNLMAKPSGCVLCIVVTPDLEVCGYRWFGGRPGQKLPDIGNREVARHTKGNAEGVKLERPNVRVIRLREFGQIESLDETLRRLFGRL